MFCLFTDFRGKVLDSAALSHLRRLLSGTPGLHQALIHTPTTTHDPYLNDGPPPVLALQLYFQSIQALESAQTKTGHLQALATDFPGLTNPTQQAMLARPYPVPDATFRTPPGTLPCTYLVAYEGEAEDLNVWLDYYVRSHPPIMARFPNIRQIEICTRIDWIGFLPFHRVAHMQRNKVVFDDQPGLMAALNSPTRHEMRADFKHFPPFTGPNTHYPMLTETLTP